MEKFKRFLTHEGLYQNIEDSIAKMTRENVSRSDLKLVAAALRELRHTFRVFAPYRDRHKVTVFGSARSKKTDPLYKMAKHFAKEIVHQGYMVMTGAGPGIMHAAQEGAGSESSFGLNIRLPFEQGANPIIREDTKLINFKYFFTRKLTMVKESDALVLFPGGFGTQDELFETLTLLQTGKSSPKPVICVDKKQGTYWKTWQQTNLMMLLKQKLVSREDINLLHFTDSVEDAVSHIVRFYENYHSIRFYNRWLLIRLQRLPSDEILKKLTKKFKDILLGGTIHPSPTHIAYDPELGHLHLKTLRMRFNQRNYGRLRQLINALNKY